MQPVVESSSETYSYAVFTIVGDDPRKASVPVGVALWSPQRTWWKVRFVGQGERLTRFNRQEDSPYIALVEGKLDLWAREGIPYADHRMEPWETEWWKAAKDWLLHRVRLSEPRPIDCRDPAEEIEPLYESVVSPNRVPREQRSRVVTQVGKCLAGLHKKYKRHDLTGYGGRPITVSRACEGPCGMVVVEAVNLASRQAEQHSDAMVSRLLRLREGTLRKPLDILVAYLPSPEGLNGEKVLVHWIKEKTGAKTFDLLKEQHELRLEAGNLAAKVAMPASHSD